MNLEDFIKKTIEADSPFVSYRLPDSQFPVTMKTSKVVVFDNPESIREASGFLIHPFAVSDRFPALFFFEGERFEGWDFDCPNHALIPKRSLNADFSSCFTEQSEAQYNLLANQLINSCKSNEIEKVVFSRIINRPLSKNFNFGRLFAQLCNANPSAFVYIFNIGNGQIWVGATPETLLTSLSGKCETMSLAGTVAHNSGQKENTTEFSQKELHEQELVTDYIVKILEYSNVKNLTKHKLEVRNAGPVKHLQKLFSFDLPFDESPINLALKLHPTPAVCGLPPKRALQIIQSIEPHNRAYYSGFLGPVSNKTSVNLFVNLRCMAVVNQKASIFVGGGITPDSSAESEWDETNLKAQTLLLIIEQQC